MPVRSRLAALSTGAVVTALVAQQPALAQQAPRDSTAADSSKAATILDPLVFTAERRPTRASDATAAVRVLNRAEITRLGATDLTTVLRDVPGVQVDPVVGSGAGVMLQGLGSDRVLVLIDGAPAVGRISGEFDLTRLDPSMFQSIEIVEGPQSTLYGSNALGGVVNLVTRENSGSRFELSSTVGSKGQRDGRGRVSGLFGNWGGSADLGRRTTDVAPGTGPTTVGFANRWDGMARVQASLGRANLDVRGMGLQENQRYRSGSTGATLNYNDNWQLDGLARVSVGNTELRAHVSGYDHKFASGPAATGIPGAPDWDRQRVFDVEGLHRGAVGRSRWLAGLKGEREWIVADRVAQGDERGGWTGAGYASVEIPVGSFFQFSSGARLTASEEWGVNAAPRAGLVARSAQGLYVKGGVARGFRAPSFKDLYQDFLNTQSFYRVRGNLDLRPETSWNVNGEIGFVNRNFKLYGRGYSNWLKDFIQTVQTGVSSGILILDYQNVGRATTRGLELGGSAGTRLLEISGAYMLLDAEDASTRLNLTGRAGKSARGAVTVSPAFLSIRGEVNYTGPVLVSRTTAGVETFQGAYTRLNASVVADLPLGIRITAGGENLANTIPERALTALGRRWHAGLTIGGDW